ncbi:MAG: sulfate transporter CysZ [Deltaproteobacteria bacterium]|nr:sulfate transporter CysZ [Deltaproteobacteria bacterium]
MKNFLLDNPAARFSKGFFYPFRAGRYLAGHPRLWKFVAIPFLVNVVVFSLLLYLGFHFFDGFVLRLIPSGEAWYWVLLYYTLWVVAVAVTAVLVFFTFTLLGNLIASPFNDLLSEKTEELMVGSLPEEPFSLARFKTDAKRILVLESKKMAVFLLVMLLLLTLNLIPGIGSLLFSVLAFFWTVIFLALEYLGFVASRKQFDFKALRRFFWSRFTLLSGFGTGVFALLAVPFLNFISIPLGVIGATLLWFENPPHQEPDRGPGEADSE